MTSPVALDIALLQRRCPDWRVRGLVRIDETWLCCLARVGGSPADEIEAAHPDPVGAFARAYGIACERGRARRPAGPGGITRLLRSLCILYRIARGAVSNSYAAPGISPASR